MTKKMSTCRPEGLILGRVTEDREDSSAISEQRMSTTDVFCLLSKVLTLNVTDTTVLDSLCPLGSYLQEQVWMVVVGLGPLTRRFFHIEGDNLSFTLNSCSLLQLWWSCLHLKMYSCFSVGRICGSTSHGDISHPSIKIRTYISIFEYHRHPWIDPS